MSKRGPSHLIFQGDNWLTTVIDMNGSAAHRELKFKFPAGEFSLKMNRVGKKGCHIGIKLTSFAPKKV